jgi:hypothetical protein
MAIHQGVEDAVHQAQVIVSGVLLLYVHKILVHGVQAAREQRAQVQADGWILFKELPRIWHRVKAGRAHRANRGGVRDVEQRGEIAKDRPRLGRSGYSHSVLHDFDSAFDEEKEEAGAIVLLEHRFARCESSHGILSKQCENVRHDAGN